MRVATLWLHLLILNVAEGLRKRRRQNAFSSCGAKGASNNASISIVNGDDSAECEWRWQVALQKRSWGKRLFCSGMLLSPEWVLTAAHCASSANFDVVAGEYNTKQNSGKEQRRKATKLVRHFKYNSNKWDYDYAMVKLDRPVEMNECAGTVCLPTAGDVKPGSTCWITGWGSERVGGAINTILQQAQVKVIGSSACGNDYGYTSCEITSNMLCAQGETADGQIIDACAYDSGGPLVCEAGGAWTLYGVTSWGDGCAKPDHPGVWSKVHEAMDWINDVLSGKTPTLPPGACPPYCQRCPAGSGCISSACSGCCD